MSLDALEYGMRRKGFKFSRIHDSGVDGLISFVGLFPRSKQDKNLQKPFSECPLALEGCQGAQLDIPQVIIGTQLF